MKTRATQKPKTVKPTIEKPQKTKVKDPVPSRAETIIRFVNDSHKVSCDYRDKFTGNWTKIDEQIRCKHPDDWGLKEDWQSKVFIPQQSKKAETAYAYLDKMLFGQPRFYSITGVEKRDKEQEGYLMELFDNVLDRGNYYFENDFVLHESCDIGTAVLKVLVRPDRKGLNFYWRSPFYCVFDPSCGHRWQNARYVIDEYKKSITELVDETLGENPIYKREMVDAMLAQMQSEVSETIHNEGDKAIATIKNIDGTSILIPAKYLEINLAEFWGKVRVGIEKEIERDGKKVKINEFKFEDRIVTVAEKKFLLRDDENPYGFIPFFLCRIKPRKYDVYGLGFCENTIDLQDLMNSMVNLGFDSLKICSMDIAAIDTTKVADPATVQYKPMAVWEMKGNPREAIQLSRQGISALNDITRGIAMLDQFDQEASGVLRSTQGTPEMGGGSGTTLGEYQAKLAMADNRFLKVARFVERDYIKSLIRGMFKIIFNKKFFSQELINRIIGLKEETVKIADPATGQPIELKQMSPKLDFNALAEITDMGFDFKATGMTQFMAKLEILQKLKELLIETVKTPQLMIISKVDEIFKRVLQAADIPDYQDLIKSDEEIKKIMEQIYNPQPQGMPAQGQPAMLPQGAGQ